MKCITNLNTFKLLDARYLFFDIFYKADKIYLISPIYNNPIDPDTIKISVNNKLLEISDVIIKDSYEPISIFIYNYKSTKSEIEVLVEFYTIIKIYTLKNINIINKHELAITTLFKYDFKLFPIYYEYYKKQGVTHFYMYYNSTITSDVKKMFDYKDVTLIEWNFEYWNIDCKYEHHAQLGQIHHAIYRYGKDICNYMIFCDLDEYLFIPEYTIINYIMENNDIDTIGFCNHWCKTLDDKIPDTFPNKFVSKDKLEYGKRSKNIFKIDSINTIGIHHPFSYNKENPKLITEFIMFHFEDWSGIVRKHI
jgi:hypothetical protein